MDFMLNELAAEGHDGGAAPGMEVNVSGHDADLFAELDETFLAEAVDVELGPHLSGQPPPLPLQNENEHANVNVAISQDLSETSFHGSHSAQPFQQQHNVDPLCLKPHKEDWRMLTSFLGSNRSIEGSRATNKAPSSRKRMAPMENFDPAFEQRREDSDDEVTMPASPQEGPPISAPPQQRGANSARHLGILALPIHEQMDLLNFITTNLSSNQRKERDFRRFYTELAAEHPEIHQYFRTHDILKQKIKLLLMLRRKQKHTKEWTKIKELAKGASENSDAVEAVFKHLNKLLPRAYEPATHYKPVAEFFVKRVRTNERGPGPLIEWHHDARKCMIDAILADHESAERKYLVTENGAFSSLLAPGEVEMALVSSCKCEGCRSWNISLDTQSVQEVHLSWMKTRAHIMATILHCHTRPDFVNSCRMRLPHVKFWSDDFLQDFLESAHSCRACEICKANGGKKRRRRTRDGEKGDSEDEDEPRVSSLDDALAELEIELLQVEDAAKDDTVGDLIDGVHNLRM